MIRYTIAFLILVCFYGCDNSTSSNGNTLSQITGTIWELRYISENSYGVEAPPVDSMFAISFSDSSTFTAWDNCNICAGTFELNGDEITIDEAVCTLALCQPTKTNIQLINELRNVQNYEVDGAELNLSYQEQEKVRMLHMADSESPLPKKAIMANEDSNRDSWEDGAYNVEFVSIEGDLLTLNISYSGCSVSDINMVFDSYFLESNPVQAYAFLPKVNEVCQAYFSEEYQFDLSTLKDEYLASYPSEGGEIIISIRENGEALSTFSYEF